MAEIIDLTSTPPLAKATPKRPPSPKNHLNTPFSAQSLSMFFTSDIDIDSSQFTPDTIEKPPKKPRLADGLFQGQSNNSNTNKVSLTSEPANPLFSDDDAIASSCNNNSVGINTIDSSSGGIQQQESDPIIFTSSAPDAGNDGGLVSNCASNVHGKPETITIDDDDDVDGGNNGRTDGKRAGGGDDIIKDLTADQELDELLGVSDYDEPVPSAAVAPAAPSNGLSSKTNSLLASLERKSSDVSTGAAGRSKKKRKGTSESDLDSDISEDAIEQPKKPARKPKKSSSTAGNESKAAEKEAKAREREAVKAQRQQDKELEKEKKQKVKEQKARQKQFESDIAQANKLKVDKKESTPEMIIDIASSLGESSVANQAVEYMKRLGVQYTFFSSSIGNIIKWRRKVKAVFNENLGHWEPCLPFIGNENHVLCLVSAQEFVDMILASDDPGRGIDSLETHVLRIKSTYKDCKPIYLIEGLTPWMRRNRNVRNRAFQAEVLRQIDDDPVTASMQQTNRQARKKTDNTPPVDDDRIEDALLQLQVSHTCLVHHTNATPESAQWIKNFTEHVSTIPYRRERMENNDSAFCMDVGQVRTGDDKTDTFIKMLQEVNRVTPSMAHGIVARYPSVGDLIRTMRVHGPEALENVKVSKV